MFNNYDEFVSELNKINFDTFYLNNISSREYCLDYGVRKGKRTFKNIKEVARQFNYDTDDRYLVNINQQFNILERCSGEEILDIDVVLLCIEIFDWGRVQNYNIIEALDRHRKKELTKYLHSCKSWFEDDASLVFSINNGIWSSGWTKVYSFLFDKTTIYDSRVSAFVNYILVRFYHSLAYESAQEIVKDISGKLVTFKGANNRKRIVDKENSNLLEIKRLNTKDVSKVMLANKISSWLLRYLAQCEYGNDSQENFRNLDKIAFMLGFDIIQIDEETGFIG